ncbi:hypothetical protein BJV82DRAFT_357151 [Fennellomyces sp. T-0311]|nr:hypothetical protein BJV82DRAFT_357151 [Fennellomyces sp. T-0311]
MSDYSSSEGSDDEYGPIATSWGDQTKAEPEKPAADWSSLENPNAKLGPSGLGSGDLHRKGRNYKPIDESLILQQRLKKTSLKSEEGKAAGRQQRRSSRPRGRFSRPSSSTSARSRPRSTFSRSSPKSLRRSSSSSTSKAPTPATTATTTTTTTTTTTVYNYARKPSLSESRQTAPWEEPPKPKKPSVRFSQPLECPTPPLMHSPKIPERALASGDNPWSNKPLMEVPFWAEPAKVSTECDRLVICSCCTYA